MKKILILIFVCTLIISCSSKIQLINFEKGEYLQGRYYKLTRSVEVIMPNGEVLKGTYSAISNATFTFNTIYNSGTTYSSANTATFQGQSTGYGINSGGASKAYAILKSTSTDLMMELIVEYSEWTGHGAGEAITNDGQRFKVQF